MYTHWQSQHHPYPVFFFNSISRPYFVTLQYFLPLLVHWLSGRTGDGEGGIHAGDNQFLHSMGFVYML